MTICGQDNGSLDGIQRILFGTGFEFWTQKLVFLDSISYLSHGRLSLSLRRFLLIDIDDIFVGESGTRMRAADVDALLSAQKKLAAIIPGFKFNLGFSGKYYHKGTPEEDEGDDMLIRMCAFTADSHEYLISHSVDHADQFWWFCHMFSHSQPHIFNNSVLESEMRLNKDFARVRSSNSRRSSFRNTVNLIVNFLFRVTISPQRTGTPSHRIILAYIPCTSHCLNSGSRFGTCVSPVLRSTPTFVLRG